MTDKKLSIADVKLNALYVYSPARAKVSRPEGSNIPPEGAIVWPVATFIREGFPIVSFMWEIEDPACPGVELQADYCVVDCLVPLSEAMPHIASGQPIERSFVLFHNFAHYRRQKELDAPLPRSAGQILEDGVDLLDERGKQYDKDGQERSAAKVAAMFSAMKGVDFSAMDVWDLMMCLKLVRAQDATTPDSRVDLTNYAALSAEEMENIVYGEGASQIAESGFFLNGQGWSITGTRNGKTVVRFGGL